MTMAPAARSLLDADRVGGRHVADEDLGMAGRRQAGDVDDVLDADRNAVQGPAQRPAALSASAASRPQRRFAIEPDEGVELGIERRDALEKRLHQLDGR